jgi:membrane fusion protein
MPQSTVSSSPPAASLPLFRAEALQAKQSQLHGSIRLMQPVSHTAWAFGAVIVVSAIASLFAWGEVTRRATVTGVLSPEAGIAKITSSVSGVLVTVKVKDNEVVSEGQPLFVISTERQSEAGATQAAIAQQMTQRKLIAESEQRRVNERFESRSRSVYERLGALDRELAQLEREVELAATRVMLAAKQLERTDALAKDGFVSASQQQVKQDEVYAAQQAQRSMERNRATLSKERLALQSQLRDAQQQQNAESAEASRALALLSQEQTENEARRITIVTAPSAGIISGLTAQTGQAVIAGANLAQLLPEASPLQAQFYVPTRSAGFVEQGQEVRLRYAAFPYQKFGQQEGIVKAVDRTPYAPRELPEQVIAALQSSATATAEAHYKVTVNLKEQSIAAYGKPQPLKPGMVVEADVIQRKNKLWEWVIEPLRGFTQKGA